MRLSHWALLVGSAVVYMCLDADVAQASSHAITELATGVQRVEATMTGPIAKSVAILALAVGAGMWAFGGDLGTIGKSAAWMFIAIGALAGAPNIISTVFNIRGAQITSANTVKVTVTEMEVAP